MRARRAARHAPSVRSRRVETRDLGEPDAGAVAAGAILHRPPQLAVARARWRRPDARSLIDQDRIAGMRLPRPAQMRRAENSDSVSDQDPTPSRVAANIQNRPSCRTSVASLASMPVSERRLLDPAVGKALRAVERDGRVGRAFRDHPDLPVVREHERIGQVPGLFEHRLGRPARTRRRRTARPRSRALLVR